MLDEWKYQIGDLLTLRSAVPDGTLVSLENLPRFQVIARVTVEDVTEGVISWTRCYRGRMVHGNGFTEAGFRDYLEDEVIAFPKDTRPEKYEAVLEEMRELTARLDAHADSKVVRFANAAEGCRVRPTGPAGVGGGTGGAVPVIPPGQPGAGVVPPGHPVPDAPAVDARP